MNKQIKEHTAEPWTYVRHENNGVESFTIVPEDHAKHWESWGVAGLCHTVQDKANAEFICLAVNSHARLVAALEHATNALALELPRRVADKHTQSAKHLRTLICEGRAALASLKP